MRATIAAVSVIAMALASCSAPGATVPPSAGVAATVAATSAPASLAASPGPDCTRFDHEAMYEANVGALPVGVTVPATTSSPWSGRIDEFELRNAPCDGNGTLWIHASLVAHVFADACHWQSSSVEAPTAFAVVSQLKLQAGHDAFVATDAHVGPFRATRLDLAVPAAFDDSTCDDGVLGLWETRTGTHTIFPGTTIQVYVAEVDGVTLVVTAGYDPKDATPELLANIDSVLASLRVDM